MTAERRIMRRHGHKPVQAIKKGVKIMMKNYVFNELKGKDQGEMIIVKAETAEEACEKAKMKEKIKPYEKFKTMYFGKT